MEEEGREREREEGIFLRVNKEEEEEMKEQKGECQTCILNYSYHCQLQFL